MEDELDLLLAHPDALVIGVPTTTPRPERNGQAQGHDRKNLGFNAESGPSGVCRPGPVAPEAPPAPTQTQAHSGPDQDQRPFVKENGKTHPFKPRTPAEIVAFSTLWRDPILTLAQIARRYRAGKRTIQVWRVRFGLPPRDELLKLQAQGATVADAASAMVNEVQGAAKTMAEIARAQAVLGIKIGLRDGPEAPQAPSIDPEAGKWDPLKDPEIAQALAEIREQARQITAHSDLGSLQRKLTQLTLLTITSAPVYTWESLSATVEGLSRTLLYARKVEAELPTKGDPQQLRKEAASIMLREAKSVLNKEEQDALGNLIKLAADRMMARGNGKPTAPTDLPGASDLHGHNGKIRPGV